MFTPCPTIVESIRVRRREIGKDWPIYSQQSYEIEIKLFLSLSRDCSMLFGGLECSKLSQIVQIPTTIWTRKVPKHYSNLLDFIVTQLGVSSALRVRVWLPSSGLLVPHYLPQFCLNKSVFKQVFDGVVPASVPGTLIIYFLSSEKFTARELSSFQF